MRITVAETAHTVARYKPHLVPITAIILPVIGDRRQDTTWLRFEVDYKIPQC